MTRRNSKPETTEAAQVEAAEAEVTEPTAEELIAQLRAEQERLLAELEAAKQAAKRAPRKQRMTPKQRRVVEYLRQHPDAPIAEACTAAGATATSHGLIFRMIEDGYLKVSPAEVEAEAADEEAEEAAEEEQAEEAATA